MQYFVGYPAEQRNVIPPSLIGEYRDYPCYQCGAELVCHEPTRQKHWDGWEIVCPTAPWNSSTSTTARRTFARSAMGHSSVNGGGGSGHQ
jgi:hypothetical protein